MIIIRDNKEYVLTEEELYDAHKEYIINFFTSVIYFDFGRTSDESLEIAKAAYKMYQRGDGKTEYECIEIANEEYENNYVKTKEV